MTFEKLKSHLMLILPGGFVSFPAYPGLPDELCAIPSPCTKKIPQKCAISQKKSHHLLVGIRSQKGALQL